MLERLEAAFEAEKQFTADASHELRTPVAVILGACEYAEKYDETPEERLETLQTIHRQGRRMAELIGQLLQMTRLDQGAEGLRLEELDLTALVRTLCAEQAAGEDRLRLDLQEGVRARGDSTLLTRLVQNLIDNAFKYGGAEGPVEVVLRRTAGEIRLTVRDYGPGIPPEELPHVKYKFYKGSSKARGSGIGLAVCEEIITRHEGTLDIGNAEGGGCLVTIRLPIET